MARKSPSGPSMSFTSRTTKVSSNVSEQNAFKRPAVLPQRLTRTSVSCMAHPKVVEPDVTHLATSRPGRSCHRCDGFGTKRVAAPVTYDDCSHPSLRAAAGKVETHRRRARHRHFPELTPQHI